MRSRLEGEENDAAGAVNDDTEKDQEISEPPPPYEAEADEDGNARRIAKGKSSKYTGFLAPTKAFESQKKFIKDVLIPSKELTPISAQSLVVGDILQAKQGDIRVIDINPDTMEPILDGGDNYGQQTIKTDSHVFVKNVHT
jgi:hypothetical protein